MRDFWLRRVRIGKIHVCLGHNPDIANQNRSRNFTFRHWHVEGMRAITLRAHNLFLDIDIL